eukprot:2566479-Rhodomonas_salina.2
MTESSTFCEPNSTRVHDAQQTHQRVRRHTARARPDPAHITSSIARSALTHLHSRAELLLARIRVQQSPWPCSPTRSVSP